MGLPWINGVICLLRKGGRTLFMDYRNYSHKIHEGKYSPPGGKVELGEESDKSAIREVFEEANIVVNDLVYRGKVHFNNEERTVNGKPMKINMTVDIYESQDFDDSNSKAKEVDERGRIPRLEWIADQEILNVPELHLGDRKMFEILSRNEQFECTIYQKGEDEVSVEIK